MTNLHYIADDKLGGVEREYTEVERKANVGDYVMVTYEAENNKDYLALYLSELCGSIYEVTEANAGESLVTTNGTWEDGSPLNMLKQEYATLDPTGNVRIDGTVYRMVDRKAAVGEKVLTLKYGDVGAVAGDIQTVEAAEYDDGSISTEEGAFFDTEEGDKYVVLELVEYIDDLTLTEADVRDNPRQVIDLIANMAGRLSKLESKVALTDDRVSRLGTANQQAYDIVSRNVETWAQEIETIKARMGDAGRALTAEERREL